MSSIRSSGRKGNAAAAVGKKRKAFDPRDADMLLARKRGGKKGKRPSRSRKGKEEKTLRQPEEYRHALDWGKKRRPPFGAGKDSAAQALGLLFTEEQVRRCALGEGRENGLAIGRKEGLQSLIIGKKKGKNGRKVRWNEGWRGMAVFSAEGGKKRGSQEHFGFFWNQGKVGGKAWPCAQRRL